MKALPWHTRAASLFAAAVLVAAIGHVVVNAHMGNGQFLAHGLMRTVGFVLPLLPSLAVFHFGVPLQLRRSPGSYLLRVVLAAAIAYVVAASLLLVLAYVATGELI